MNVLFYIMLLIISNSREAPCIDDQVWGILKRTSHIPKYDRQVEIDHKGETVKISKEACETDDISFDYVKKPPLFLLTLTL